MQSASDLSKVVETPNAIFPAIDQCIEPTANSPLQNNC